MKTRLTEALLCSLLLTLTLAGIPDGNYTLNTVGSKAPLRDTVVTVKENRLSYAYCSRYSMSFQQGSDDKVTFTGTSVSAEGACDWQSGKSPSERECMRAFGDISSWSMDDKDKVTCKNDDGVVVVTMTRMKEETSKETKKEETTPEKKPVETPKAPQQTAKPAPETKPAPQTKPAAEAKPAETKPAQTKPTQTKPAETKPTLETKSAEKPSPKSEEIPKPAQTPKNPPKTEESKPTTPAPAQTPKPVEKAKPVETPKPQETHKPAETSKPAETPKPTETATPEPAKTPAKQPTKTPPKRWTPKKQPVKVSATTTAGTTDTTGKNTDTSTDNTKTKMIDITSLTPDEYMRFVARAQDIMDYRLKNKGQQSDKTTTDAGKTETTYTAPSAPTAPTAPTAPEKSDKKTDTYTGNDTKEYMTSYYKGTKNFRSETADSLKSMDMGSKADSYLQMIFSGKSRKDSP